jgi:transcription elongation factor GreB
MRSAPMSKAFTKEDDRKDGPLNVSDEALPPGVKNYVTPAGLARLRQAAPGSPILQKHLEAAEVIDPLQQPKDRVLFGATVTVRIDDRDKTYRIVGIDEVDVKRGWISWRSPIAKALLNQGVGATVAVHTPRGEEDWEVIAIEYVA